MILTLILNMFTPIAQVFYYSLYYSPSLFVLAYKFDLSLKSISCFEYDSTSSIKLNHFQVIHLGNGSYNYRVPVE